MYAHFIHFARSSAIVSKNSTGAHLAQFLHLHLSMREQRDLELRGKPGKISTDVKLQSSPPFLKDTMAALCRRSAHIELPTAFGPLHRERAPYFTLRLHLWLIAVGGCGKANILYYCHDPTCTTVILLRYCHAASWCSCSVGVGTTVAKGTTVARLERRVSWVRWSKIMSG